MEVLEGLARIFTASEANEAVALTRGLVLGDRGELLSALILLECRSLGLEDLHADDLAKGLKESL